MLGGERGGQGHCTEYKLIFLAGPGLKRGDLSQYWLNVGFNMWELGGTEGRLRLQWFLRVIKQASRGQPCQVAHHNWYKVKPDFVISSTTNGPRYVLLLTWTIISWE